MLAIRPIFFAILLLGAMPLAQASSSLEREYALKAGFIFNFAMYSQGHWFSADTAQSYVICSSDTTFIAIANSTLKNKSVHGVPVENRLIDTSTSHLTECNTLFVSASQQESWRTLLGHAMAPTMLVGETADFLDTGGHISFFLAGGKIRFEVSPEKLKNAGIQMSSKVLRLGKVR